MALAQRNLRASSAAHDAVDGSPALKPSQYVTVALPASVETPVSSCSIASSKLISLLGLADSRTVPDDAEDAPLVLEASNSASIL